MSPAQQTPTQVSLRSFPDDVQARDLADFLEASVGVVLRCKIKKPPDSIPPHAFVHFASPKVAQEAIGKADRGHLLLRPECRLEARIDDRAWLTGLRGLNSKVNSYILLTDVKVEVGCVVGPETMLVSWRGPEKGLFLRVEPAGRRLRFFFCQSLQLGPESKKTRCDIMMEMHVQEIKEVREVEREVDPVLLLHLSSPPWLFYRTAEDDIYEYDRDPSLLADDEDPWIRCSDIVTPHRSIGRCFDYRLTVSPRQRTSFLKVVAYFRKHNVLQKSLQAAYALNEEKPNSNHGLFYTVPHQKDISFDAMILVNSLVHRGILHASNLSATFYDLLKADGGTSAEVGISSLRMMLSYKRPVLKPVEELRSLIQKVGKDKTFVTECKLTEETMLVRRLIITPTRAICLPPEFELSNRVLRCMKGSSDRLLRVSFQDEDGQSIPVSSLTVQIAPILRAHFSNIAYPKTTVYNRIVTVMMDGFALCGREYHFLAYSNGQLKGSSAWFYATDGFNSVNQIREWIGTFPDRNAAKHAARMGQCFSATYSIAEVPEAEVFHLADVKRNGYDFSDGCGKISPEFAQLVAKVLKLSENPPSAYQIRYAGYKGVVAVWPIETSSGKIYKLALRDNMHKFQSYHRQLEVCSWSKFMPCYLNRQIITLLSTLNVDDKVFEELQEAMVQTLNRMVVDRDLAYKFLVMSCAGNLCCTALRMLCAGFDPVHEAYLKSMLVAIRAKDREILELEGASSDFIIPEPVYDSDLEVVGFEGYLEKAWAMKQSYDGQLQAIMTQFNITNEAEVVTGHVVIGGKTNSRTQGEVKERVAYAYGALHKEYSKLVNPPDQGNSKQDSDGVLSSAFEEDLLAQASACYHITYHRMWYKKAQDMNLRQRPFLSFPWVAVDLLIGIKNRKRSSISKDFEKAVPLTPLLVDSQEDTRTL